MVEATHGVVRRIRAVEDELHPWFYAVPHQVYARSVLVSIPVAEDGREAAGQVVMIGCRSCRAEKSVAKQKELVEAAFNVDMINSLSQHRDHLATQTLGSVVEDHPRPRARFPLHKNSSSMNQSEHSCH